MVDKRVFISNIYQLAKERGLKIGDLEKKAGVSPGYISRINKGDSNATPSIDFVATVAKTLGVTVDALINNDYTLPTATEKYLLEFLDKLLAQTNADQLDWKKETVNQLQNVGYDQDGDAEHPLFTVVFENDAPCIAYNSRFDSDCVITGDCFRLKLPGVDRTSIYLMCVDDPSAVELPFKSNGYELYMVQNWKVQPLCRALLAGGPFYQSLSNLYSAAMEACKHPKLDTEVMQAINTFMSGTVFSGLFDDSGELPF